MKVLSVAYPLAPVGPNAVGGAEQVLAQLDAALVAAGHESVVLAQQGSETVGRLLPTPSIQGPLDEKKMTQAWRGHREAIQVFLAREQVDLVHFHGLDFHRYLPAAGPPALVTLHLPRPCYPDAALSPDRERTWFNCVSETQRTTFQIHPGMVATVSNGVPMSLFSASVSRKRFCLCLGRICPEKGYHLALDAARLAQTPLLLGGEVFQYPSHLEYFEREIVPRLGRWGHLLGPVGFRRKRRLLSAARCLLVPSLIAETSSLVAMEALACGTPVVCFPAGALPEIVEHGKTGFLVQNVREMAEAIAACTRLDPDACRQTARERFSADRMCRNYFALYRELTDVQHTGSPTEVKHGSEQPHIACPG